MRFINSTLKDDLSRDRMRTAAGIAAVTALCLLVSIGVYTVFESWVRADRARRKAQAEVLQEAAQSAEAAGVSEETFPEQEETMPAQETEEQEETAAAQAAPDQTEAEQTQTEAILSAETQATETTDPNVPVEFYTTVYAGSDINLRSGPGTGYDVVRLIHVGEQIDVTGRTATGWYRTYSGNFVLTELTSEEPVATTTSPTAATTAATQATTAATTQSRPTTPPINEGNTAGTADTSGMTYYGVCHITFYGPQIRSDGTYSITTATGTTCSEGRTVAADWSIFPSGTVLYLPNDPLGGDGYYTVEDHGPGVNGAHLDIFANGSHTVTDCDVYIVN